MPTHILTPKDIEERIKGLQERLDQMKRRDKLVGDLKQWIVSHKLEVIDVHVMLRALKPKRAREPVVSKKPLQPPKHANGKQRGEPIRRGDPEFRSQIHDARLVKQWTTADLAGKLGVSEASVANWEQGRNIPKNEARLKLLKTLDLPLHLGEAASLEMQQAIGKH